MASADDRPEDFAPLEPEDRPARRRPRQDEDDEPPHYEEPHRGVLILVLGIVGLVACQLVGIAAWIMGSGDLKKMDEGIMDPEGRSNTQVGRILGIIATIWLALGVILFMLYLIGIAAFIGFAAQQKANAPVIAPVAPVEDKVPDLQKPPLKNRVPE
jgi:hypothetical protein